MSRNASRSPQRTSHRNNPVEDPSIVYIPTRSYDRRANHPDDNDYPQMIHFRPVASRFLAPEILDYSLVAEGASDDFWYTNPWERYGLYDDYHESEDSDYYWRDGAGSESPFESDIEFEVYGFRHDDEDGLPSSPTGEEEEKADREPMDTRSGYTRTLLAPVTGSSQSLPVICPKCSRELGAGVDSLQRSVWAGKCGHVYCGECAAKLRMGRATGAKRQLCVVEGCKSSVGGTRNMFEVFL